LAPRGLAIAQTPLSEIVAWEQDTTTAPATPTPRPSGSRSAWPRPFWWPRWSPVWSSTAWRCCRTPRTCSPTPPPWPSPWRPSGWAGASRPTVSLSAIGASRSWRRPSTPSCCSPWPSMCWSRGSSVSSIPNPSSRPACWSWRCWAWSSTWSPCVCSVPTRTRASTLKAPIWRSGPICSARSASSPGPSSSAWPAGGSSTRSWPSASGYGCFRAPGSCW